MTDTDHVALLGTKGGPAIRPGSAMPTSSLVTLEGQRIVVDCGLGVSRGLCDQGMALADLTTIFVTHLHSDHYLELGPLLHTAWTAGLRTHVTVWGPPGLDRYWKGFLASLADDIDLRIADEGRPDLRGLVTIHPLEAGMVTHIGPIEVRALRVDHPPLTDCFALSFAGRKRVVFSADTAPFPPLADFARGADLLIHEAMLPQAVQALVARVGNGDGRLLRHIERSHTAAEDAARIATLAGVHALALHHLLPSDDPNFGPEDWTAAVAPHWSGPLYLGRDGLRIPL
ncbi:hydrolase [Jannaschia pagri]|uniref:Hydrolase n=1 Tax=Jannaschia pagri TaxID=2829797 RepID=A0ABQ4NLA7_9RHOB|nr:MULTISPECIES: MBL fold metallo-hydrolase [unclassified Jannaschia]GIT91358.1 hydrolase [Jannaschia sp. AI_61]GIT95192.1 hydrolase [Jannaschia sp. AI_62]